MLIFHVRFTPKAIYFNALRMGEERSELVQPSVSLLADHCADGYIY
jgi:hypothetical protein